MTGPTYNPNIPTPKTKWSQWQPLFQENFTVLNDDFSVNHIPLTSSTNAGNHTNIQLFENTKDQQVSSSELAIYSKEVTGQTDQLFINQFGVQPYQYSNYQIYQITDNQYFTFLPGKLILYFGLWVLGTNFKFNPPIVQNVISATFVPAAPITSYGAATYSNQPRSNGVIPGLTIYTVASQYYNVVCNV